MTDPKRPEKVGPDPGVDPTVGSPAAPSPETPVKPQKQLTPEEQMALYEEDLKENDWGHQPC